MPLRHRKQCCLVNLSNPSTWTAQSTRSIASIPIVYSQRRKIYSSFSAQPCTRTARSKNGNVSKTSDLLSSANFATTVFPYGADAQEPGNDDSQNSSSQNNRPSQPNSSPHLVQRGRKSSQRFSFSEQFTEYMNLNDHNTLQRNRTSDSTKASVTRPDVRRSVSDEFCARVFATKAFHPSFVMQTLSAFGVTTIGPLALQALVQRCLAIVDEEYQPLYSDRYDVFVKEVDYHLERAKHFSLAIPQTAYTLLVRKLVRNANGKLLEFILTSDHHPDVYDNRALQLEFLRSFVRQEQTLHVDKTLHILTLKSTYPTIAAWNLLMRAQMYLPTSQRWTKLSQTLDHMIAHNIPITTDTLDESYRTLIRPRAPSKRPIALPQELEFDDLLFVTNLWIKVLTHQPKAPLDATYWREILKRFGMLGRLASLESLINWLIRAYAYPSPSLHSRAQSTLVLNKIFPPATQRAIISWFFGSLGFQKQHPTNEIHFPPKSERPVEPNVPQNSPDTIKKWARGVALVYQLRELGVQVDKFNLQRVCLQHFITLFEKNNTSNSITSRFAKKRNVLTLPYMIRYLQQVTARDVLFPIPSSLLFSTDQRDEARLKRTVVDLCLETRRGGHGKSREHRDPRLLTRLPLELEWPSTYTPTSDDDL